ncbi:MAG: GTPase [Pseudoclavibacter sp.]
MSRVTLDERLAALREARELADGRLDDATLDDMDGVLARAGARRELSGDHTVAGFFGATGSGKSSLFNAVVGDELARVHVRRPTTSEPLAAVWNPQGSEPLLDWLEVADRRQPQEPFDGDASLSLVLLDLPDFDSVELGHRAVTERLAGQVDVLVWVVDPQKYADAVLHADFVQRFAAHSAVTAVVLNQVDRLSPGDVRGVVASLEELLRRDGLTRVPVATASATTGAGVDDVRGLVRRFASKRAAQNARIEADLTSLATRIAPSFAGVTGEGAADDEGDAGAGRTAGENDARVEDLGVLVAGKTGGRAGVGSGRNDKRRAAQLVRELGAAAGVDDVAAAVGRSYAKRTGQATGWPLTSWLLRLRPDPLRRMHLLTSTARATKREGRDPELHRTALPQLSAGQQAQAGRAVRDFADGAADGLPDAWRASIRRQANASIETLPAELDRAIARTDLGARGSWWWGVVAVVQWVALLAALVGVGWYLAVWLLPLWGLPAPELTLVEGWPVPMLFIAAGVLLGILLGLASQAIGAGVGGARRRRARRRLTKEITSVVDQQVIAPIAAEREHAGRVARLLARAAGR